MNDDAAIEDRLTGHRVSGLYASYRGKTYRVARYTPRAAGGEVILQISEVEAATFADIRSSDPVTAAVHLRELDGLISVDLRGRFAGRVIEIMSMDDCLVTISANAGGGWGRDHGLTGSQYDGFRGTVRRRDVEIIGEEVRDLLPREMRRASKNL